MRKNIAVVGNIDSILIFKTVGFDVFGVTTESKCRNVLNKLMTEYKLIYITDEYAKSVEDLINDSLISPYPVITVLPSGNQKNDYALNKIKEGVEKSLGVNILFDKEKK